MFVVLSLDFLSVANAASFPTPFNTEPTPGGPMAAAASASSITLPPGFHCSVFAAEPDVAQPIAMATDARGRLWVAENYTYSERTTLFHPDLRDRIVIFEDTDNDGRFDRRTVFWDGAQRLTSIELGSGGVWALCLPQLVFIPDRDADDRPDGPPEVILEGFDFVKARHNVANGLRWGPDGWLYGRHGILGDSLIGPPGSNATQRTSLNVGVWRFHPQRRTFEIVTEGTTNPWGMDWDAHGEGFFINTVIGHLWQIIPGAHYRRMFGPDRNPRVYDLIDQHADHVHWSTREAWSDVRKGATAATLADGGGHAHTGLLIYQGGQWPPAWNGKLLTLNYHGRRVNVERLERVGSATIGRREPDAFQFRDPWFRGLDLLAAPDGSVFVSDWSDTGECHDNDGVHRTSGRIFKLSYGNPGPREHGDLAKASGPALVQLQLSDNEWLARQARRILVDRAVAGDNLASATAALEKTFAEGSTSVHRLRALWALHVTGKLRRERLREALTDRDEHVRTWAIRLLADDRAVTIADSEMDSVVRLAAHEESALVRLALASMVQRLPGGQGARLIEPLLSRAGDAKDHNLPLMLWYGLEPLAAVPGVAWEKIAASTRLPVVSQFAARRLAEEIDLAPQRLDALLAGIAQASGEIHAAALEGMAQALVGRPTAPKPAAWDSVRKRLAAGASGKVTRRIRQLSALFGDAWALDEIRALAVEPTADLKERQAALQTLIDMRVPDLRAICTDLLAVNSLSALAVAGLAVIGDPALAQRIIAEWPRFTAEDRAAILSGLLSRPDWIAPVLDAVANGKIERNSLTAFHARQVQSHRNPELTRRLSEVTAVAHSPSTTNSMATWQRHLTSDSLTRADLTNGRALFQARCAACHQLNGAGGAIGPDLTGAARDNLNYLLENILSPSATVANDYRLTLVTLKDGRIVSGMIRERSAASLTLQSMADTVTVMLNDVVKQETSTMSLMPPGLLEGLEPAQVRDLIGFLMTKNP